MHRLRLFAGSMVALATVLGSAPALANGRFPRAQRLLEDARNPNHLVLAATYGLLVTSNRGASWQYVCEAAYGETDLPIDALTAFTAEGALLAGIYSGVSRAAEEPCGFVRTLGMTNRQAVPDFALTASIPGRVLAVMVELPEQGQPFSRLYRSNDDGLSWQPLGERLPESLKTPLTIDVAPSDAERVYLSGLGSDDEGVLLRSDDGGESFEALAIPTAPLQFEHPYIAAVDSEDAQRLYVRTDVWVYDPETSSASANDALLVSEDGGEHFAEVARFAGKIFGFAFSPDGSELLLGYGDPLEAGGSRFTEPDALGIYRGPKRGPFAKVYAGSVGCLTWTEQGLYVCTHESDTDFSLGVITDMAFDLQRPAELQPMLTLADVDGPIECPACSNGAVCRSYWESTCQSWGRADCVHMDAPRCESAGGASGEAGAGAPADAGAAPSDSAGAPVGGSAGVGPELEARGGCACRSVPATKSGAAPLLVLSLLLQRRRRRR